MRNFCEEYQVISLLDCFSTKAATSRHKVKVAGGEKIALLCELGGSSAIGATFVSGAATGICNFQVLEATAASAAGSAVSGATLSLGVSTANVIGSGAGVAIGIIQVTSDLTTGHVFTVCGSTFHTATTGPGRNGEDVATEVAAVINAHSTLSRFVEAVPNLSGTGIIELWPKPACTGISMETGDASAVMGYRKCQGIINLDVSKLSTTSPKYIGVSLSTYNCATAIRSVKLIKKGINAPAFTGKVVNV